MATRDELKSRASQIKNEVEDGSNTANRVGGLLEDMVESMAEVQELNDAVENVNKSIEESERKVDEKLKETDESLSQLALDVSELDGNSIVVQQLLPKYRSTPYIMHGYFYNGEDVVHIDDNPDSYSIIRFCEVISGEIVSLYNISGILSSVIKKNDGTFIDVDRVWDGTYFNITAPCDGDIYVGIIFYNGDGTVEHIKTLLGDNGIKRDEQLVSLKLFKETETNTMSIISGVNDTISSLKSKSDNRMSNFAQYGKFIDPNDYSIKDANFCMILSLDVDEGDTVYIPHMQSIEYNRTYLKKENSWINIPFENLSNEFISFNSNEKGTLYIDLRHGDVVPNWWENYDMNKLKVSKTNQTLSKEDGKALSLLIGGANGKVLSEKTLYNSYNKGILKKNAQKDFGHDEDYFFTNMICHDGDFSNKTPLVIECELMNIHDFYATVFLFDRYNNFVTSINISGKQTLILDPCYKLMLCSSNNTKGTIYIGKTSDLVSNSNANVGSILWLGTSIPAGAMYPEDVQGALGYKVYNKAYGGSPLINIGQPNSLALSFEEKVTNGLCDTTDSLAKELSYENRVLPYVDGTKAKVDAVVFDHGYNDQHSMYLWFKNKCIEKNLITTEADFKNEDGSYKENLVDMIDSSWFDWQDTKTSWTYQEKAGDFVSSFNFIRHKILSANPYVKIIICSHLENKSCKLDGTSSWSGMLGKLVCKIQEIIARHYGYAFIDMYNMTGWSKVHAMPNSSRQIIDDYMATTGQEVLIYWQNSIGNISTFQYFCPDGVHPQSDLSGNTRKYLSQLFIKALDKLI